MPPKPPDSDLNDPIDASRRQFLSTTATVLGGCGVVCALIPLVTSLLPNTATRAAAGPVRVDLTGLKPGEQISVVWRGQPVWIVRRTQLMLANLLSDTALLRDPDSRVNQQPTYAANWHRSIKPEYLVLIGVCTHLGCVPVYAPKAMPQAPHLSAGFYCPCHGSCFDLAGRVLKNMPAPLNLTVPPHRFITPHVLEIGENSDE